MILSTQALSRRTNVIDLEDHLHKLGGKANLLLLANQSLDHMLLLHV